MFHSLHVYLQYVRMWQVIEQAIQREGGGQFPCAHSTRDFGSHAFQMICRPGAGRNLQTRKPILIGDCCRQD
jgi:hypothetical protein